MREVPNEKDVRHGWPSSAHTLGTVGSNPGPPGLPLYSQFILPSFADGGKREAVVCWLLNVPATG